MLTPTPRSARNCPVRGIFRRSIDCVTHGAGLDCYVCKHLIEGDEPGFNETAHDPTYPRFAWCDFCEELSIQLDDDLWHKLEYEFWRLICENCYDSIKQGAAGG